ncbi:MAG TPA: OmpH family outer membrane protein [Polyangiaceae bacterium]|nr:OmpH family outer membrane protein [Polyangiaceae bacterium]
MRALFAFAIASMLLVLPASRAHAEGIAVVDLQGAVLQTEDGIRAQATLKKLFDKRQQDLDSKQSRLAKMRQDIERQAKVLSRESLARRMEAWQREMLELQSVFVDYNKELEKKQREMTAPILQKMVAIISRLAQKSGYDLVLDKSAAPYARPDLDLTDKVVAAYNSGEAN